MVLPLLCPRGPRLPSSHPAAPSALRYPQSGDVAWWLHMAIYCEAESSQISHTQIKSIKKKMSSLPGEKTVPVTKNVSTLRVSELQEL